MNKTIILSFIFSALIIPHVYSADGEHSDLALPPQSQSRANCALTLRIFESGDSSPSELNDPHIPQHIKNAFTEAEESYRQANLAAQCPTATTGCLCCAGIIGVSMINGTNSYTWGLGLMFGVFSSLVGGVSAFTVHALLTGNQYTDLGRATFNLRNYNGYGYRIISSTSAQVAPATESDPELGLALPPREPEILDDEESQRS